MDEKYYQINPIVSDAIVHNFRIISHIRSVTSIFFGLVAGILNLTSYYGLLFYIFGTFFVSLIIFFILTKRRPSLYFLYQREIWTKDVFSGLLSFMLSCTLSYNLVYGNLPFFR